MVAMTLRGLWFLVVGGWRRKVARCGRRGAKKSERSPRLRPPRRRRRCGVKTFVTWVRRNHHRLSLNIIYINEYRTSQVCTGCWLVGRKAGVVVDGRASWAIRMCNNCGLVADRDKSAAAAMLAALIELLREAGVDRLHSRKLRGFAEVAFQ